MADIIQLRGGTAAAWTSANTVLANKEVGVETDTRKLKIGNGVTAWNSLNYLLTSIISAAFDGSNHLILTLSDGSTIDAGTVGDFAPIYHSHQAGFDAEPIVYTYATSAYAAGTTYKAGTVVIDATIPYGSLVDGNVGNTPASSPAFWRTLPDTAVPAGDANHAYILVESADVWFATDAARDNHTLHTIVESGWLILTSDVSNYLYANRDNNAWLLSTTLYTDSLQYLMYMEMFCRASSRSAHKQKVELNAHGELELSNRRKFTTDERYKREVGALMGLTCTDTTLAIALGGGGVYTVNHRYEIPVVVAATRIFKCELQSGVWAYASATAPTLYSNTQYNGTTGLATLTNGYYGILWLWRGIEDEDHLYAAFSQEEYATIDLAKAAKKLAVEPPLATSHALAIGRLVFQKSQTTGIICESAFDSVFAAASAVTDHGGMGGLGDDDHTQYHNDTRGDARYLTKANTNLSGLAFAYSTTVGGNPAVGTIRVGNGTLSTATLLHISQTDGGSQSVHNLLSLLGVAGCWIKLYDRTAPATNYHWYKTTGTFAGTGSPAYEPIPVAWQFGAGSFTDAMSLDVTVELIPADAAGGANKQVIFNDSGVENGDAALMFDKALKQLLLAAGMIGNTAINNPTPVASTLLQYVGDFGGRLMPKFMGPSGMDWPVQPHIGFQKITCIQATGSGVSSQGSLAFTSNGGSSIAYAAATTGSILNQLAKITLSTGTTAGTVTYYRPPSGDAQCYIGNAAGSGGFTFMCRFNMSALQSGQRVFVGLHPRGNTPTNQDPINEVNVIGLTCIANSGNWAISSNDNTSTGVATTLASPAIPVNTTDVIEIILYAAPNSSSVSYRITDWTTGAQVTGTISSNLPVANTVIVPYIWMTNNAQNASVTLQVNKIYLETDY